MEVILTYCIQVNVLLFVIYIGYHVLLRGLTFYQLNRYYFVFGGIFSLIYPFVNVPALFKTTMEPVGDFVSYLPGMLQEQTTKGITLSLQGVVLGIFAVGALFFMVKFSIQLLSLLRIHRHSERDSWHNYLYRNVWLPIVPFSFFNKIYLNRQQHQEVELQDIFEHEYMHVRGYHSVDILLYELLIMFCWYNPCIWLMRRAMRQNLEFLTDQEVLNAGADKQSYQYSLIHVTKQGEQIGISNQFNFKMLKKRISMMNKKRSSSFELSKYIFLLPFIIFSAAAFTVTKADAKIAELVQLAEQTNLVELPHNLITNAETDNASFKKTEGTLLVKAEKFKDTVSVRKKTSAAATGTEIGLVTATKDTLVKGKVGEIIIRGGKGLPGKEPVYTIDGVIVGSTELRRLNPDDIESLNVIKDAGVINSYGEGAKNGVVEIKLKKTQSTSSGKDDTAVHRPTIQIRGSGLVDRKAVVVIVDGVKMADSFELNQLDQNEIKSITVKKDAALEMETTDSKKSVGVIEIQTKKMKSTPEVKEVKDTKNENSIRVESVYVPVDDPNNLTFVSARRYADDKAKAVVFEGKGVTIQARKREGTAATDNERKVIVINAVGRKTN